MAPRERGRSRPNTFQRAEPGYVRSPLFKRPRNAPCFCGSGQKWKKCHMDKVPEYIPKEELAEHEEMLKEMGQ